MTRQQFERICLELVKVVRERAPRDTGNLANNGIRFVWEDEDTFTIYVDGDGKSGIAPYMPFTNEPWIHKRWNGKKNPNEAWWQDAVRICIEHLTSKYGGKEEK